MQSKSDLITTTNCYDLEPHHTYTDAVILVMATVITLWSYHVWGPQFETMEKSIYYIDLD